MGKYVLLVASIFISSCKFYSNSKTCNDSKIIDSRFQNAAIHQMTIQNCVDTSFHTVIALYLNGDTESVTNFFKGKKNGLTKLFNKEGQLSRIEFNKDDKVDSVWQSFDKNGQKKSVQYYTEFPRQVSDIEFDSNGVIVLYLYIYDNEIVTSIEYSNTGRIIKSQGNYLIALRSEKPDSSILVGDTIRYVFFIAEPPGDSIRFSAAVHEVGDTDSVSLDVLPIVNSKAVFSYRATKSGKYRVSYEILVWHKNDLQKTIPRFSGEKTITINDK